MAHQRRTFFDGGKRQKMQIKIFPVHLHEIINVTKCSRLTTALGASLVLLSLSLSFIAVLVLDEPRGNEIMSVPSIDTSSNDASARDRKCSRHYCRRCCYCRVAIKCTNKYFNFECTSHWNTPTTTNCQHEMPKTFLCRKKWQINIKTRIPFLFSKLFKKRYNILCAVVWHTHTQTLSLSHT